MTRWTVWLQMAVARVKQHCSSQLDRERNGRTGMGVKSLSRIAALVHADFWSQGQASRSFCFLLCLDLLGVRIWANSPAAQGYFRLGQKFTCSIRSIWAKPRAVVLVVLGPYPPLIISFLSLISVLDAFWSVYLPLRSLFPFTSRLAY